MLALGWSALLAVSAIESFRKEDPYREWINTTGKDHDLVADLGPHDTQPERERRPACRASRNVCIRLSVLIVMSSSVR